MTVELPEDWNGMFFGKEEASKIANMTAKEFAESLTKGQPEDAKFFLAGAIFDFQWHGQSKKATELIKTASEMFEGPYEVIPEWISFGKKHIKSGMKEQEIKSMFYRFIGETFEDQTGVVVVLDLRICTVGMSCDEFTIIIIAGPLLRKDLPMSMQKRMEEHEKACSYHQSEIFHQFAIGVPVTKELEEAADKIIEKYSK